MRRLVVGVAVVALALAGNPAGGHDVVKEDPNDTPGKFDIRWTSMGHTDTKVILKTKVSGELRKRDFTDGNYFVWGLDTEPEKSRTLGPALVLPEDYFAYLEARNEGDGLEMLCFLYDEKGLVAEKPGAISTHVGTCKFPRTRFGGVPDRFRAGTTYNKNDDWTPFKNH